MTYILISLIVIIYYQRYFKLFCDPIINTTTFPVYFILLKKKKTNSTEKLYSLEKKKTKITNSFLLYLQLQLFLHNILFCLTFISWLRNENNHNCYNSYSILNY